MIRVVALGADDVDVWRTLRLDGIRRYPNAFIATEDEAAAIPLQTDRDQLASGTRFAAFQDGTAIAIAGINRHGLPRAAHRAEIGPFYVTPHAQGTGAAKALMAALIAYADALGVWQLELTVAQTNARAIRFYENHGFQRKGEFPNAIIGTDGPENDFFYVRQLTG